MKNVKWAFFGSSLVSAYWNGAATYYRGLIRSLAALGHDVTFYEPDAYDRQTNRDLADPDWARVRVYAPHEDALSVVLEESLSADVVVKCSGVGVFDRELESRVLEQRRPGQLVVFWDVDAPATLERVELDAADPFRSCIPHYDLVLTYGGGDPVVTRYSALGARRCIPVYNALDPTTHHPAKKDSRFEGLLGFLGNRLPDREKRVEDFFLDPVGRIQNGRFVLGGAGWGDKRLPENVSYVGHVYTHEHNSFNCSLRAVLNLSRESMANTGFSPATRVFEAAGAGACVITDAWRGIDTFFEPGSEILVASSGAEVLSILDGLTNERAREVGEAALRRVLAEHTYGHRAVQVDRIIRGRG